MGIIVKLGISAAAIFSGTQIYDVLSERKPALPVTRCEMTETVQDFMDPAVMRDQTYSYIYPAPPVAVTQQIEDAVMTRVNDLLGRPLPAVMTHSQTAYGEMIGTSHADVLDRCFDRAKHSGRDLKALEVTSHLYAVNGSLRSIWEPVTPLAFGRKVIALYPEYGIDRQMEREWADHTADLRRETVRIQRLTGVTDEYVASLAPPPEEELADDEGLTNVTEIALSEMPVSQPAPVPTSPPAAVVAPKPSPRAAEATESGQTANVPPPNIPVIQGEAPNVMTIEEAAGRAPAPAM